MSGLTASMQASAASTRPSGSDTASAEDDTAASLRAAALSTLKSRRKAHTSRIELPAGLPPRPATNSTQFELDYGSEEPQAGTSLKPSPALTSAVVPRPAPAPTPAIAPAPAPEHMDVDDEQAREEGEISDTESTPAHKSPQALVRSVLSKPPVQQHQTSHSPIRDRLSRSPLMPPPSLVPVPAKLEQKPSPPAEANINTVLQARFDNRPMIIDEDHVRPGLSMSQVQYDAAKDIILDLLGWGVPPEYLVDCGLSREIVYYVFIELNLRLPANLDLTGLPQLDSFFSASPEPISPPSSRSPRQRSDSSSLRIGTPRPVQPHPSLPQKPSDPQGTDGSVTPSTPLSATAPPFIPTATTAAVPMSASESSPSLIDIEQQRRQELLARKAVLASRKLKLAAAAPSDVPNRPSSGGSQEVKDVEMMLPLIPTETVENFLSSIPAVNTECPSALGGDDMDIDGIPGLSISGNVSASPKTMVPGVSPVDTPTTETSTVLPSRSTSSSSRQSTRDPSMERNIERGMSLDLASDSSGTRMTNGPRRGTKRPVAADFVDMEPGLSRSYPMSVPEGWSQPRAHHNHRHRPQSFAGLTTTRRVVIDLSDSESEDEASSVPPRPKHHHHQRPVRTNTTTPLHQLSSPSLLLEKEEEIRRMRELIAQRERALGKRASNPTRTTPPTESVNPPTSPAPPVKQEEDDSTATVSLKPSATTAEDTDRRVTADPLSARNSIPPSTSTSGPTTPTGPLYGPLASSRFTDSWLPVGSVSNTLEHPATGDKVITAEARHEQVPSVAFPASQATVATVETTDMDIPTIVDAVGYEKVTSSAQSPFPQAGNTYSATIYRSLFSLYPLLRLHLPYHSLLDTRSPLSDSASPVRAAESYNRYDLLPALDFKLLKVIAFHNRLQDTSSMVCQYEVPGGGECRDSQCEDVHPSRIWAVEPSDEETARFIHRALPEGSHLTVKQLQATLEDVHRRRPTASLETRVAEALGAIGLQAAA